MSSARPKSSRCSLIEYRNGTDLSFLPLETCRLKKARPLNPRSKCKCDIMRVTGTWCRQTVISWMRASSGRITFLTSSASRSPHPPRLCLDDQASLLPYPPSPPLPPPYSASSEASSLSSSSPFPPPPPLLPVWEGNLEGRRIKVSLPLQSASRERISSSRTTKRRRAARRSERVAERFGAITSFRFSKPACVKEHVCRPAIKYWWAPLGASIWTRAREPS